jgi:broad specificity phosphatase PhoE
MMRLLLVRHGVTEHTISRRYSGQNAEPLSELGQSQASAIATLLKRESITTLVTSDLARAYQTALAIADTCKCELYLDPDLRELAMGAWDGLTYDEARTKFPSAMAAWEMNPETATPPEGESLSSITERIARALDRWYSHDPNGTVAWITHGGPIGILLCLLLGLPSERHWHFRATPGSLAILEVGLAEHASVPGRYYAILERWNVTASSIAPSGLTRINPD